MKSARTVVVACLASAVACGCASQPTSRMSSANEPAGVDVEYVQAVERRARIAGIEVQWINVPTKYKSKTDE